MVFRFAELGSGVRDAHCCCDRVDPVIKRCAQGSVQDAVRFRRRLSPRISKVMCVALVTIDCGLIGIGSVLSAQVVADAVSGSEELSVRCLAHKRRDFNCYAKEKLKGSHIYHSCHLAEGDGRRDQCEVH